jgi:DHA1 family inner membrane transport protein
VSHSTQSYVASKSWRTVVIRLVILALALFLVATNAFILTGFLPTIASDLRTEVSVVSLSISAYAVTVAVMSPVVPLVFSRISRTTLLVVGAVLVAVGIALAAFAPDLTTFFVGRVVGALGGAALVPTATASAIALAPEGRKGASVSIVASGFTAAAAFGAPAGTALSALVGWRACLFVIAAMTFLAAAAIAISIRRVPIESPVSMRRRFAALGDPRLAPMLLGTVVTIAAFQMAYIFSADITAEATGADPSRFAALLLFYGIASLVGNALGGWLTDRVGSFLVISVLAGAQVIATALLGLVSDSMVVCAIVYTVWGIAGGGQQPAMQYRLSTIDPATASVAIAWNSTALYVALALAPLLGSGTVILLGGSQVIPFISAGLLLAGTGIVLSSYRSRAVGLPLVRL